MAERDRPPVPISRPRGRASWDNPTFGYNNPWSQIPPTQNFALYAALRESIPILSAAITKKRQLIGCPLIDAKDETKREVLSWLGNLNVNHIQHGWNNALGTWIDSAMLFGRGHMEMILNSDRSDVWGLQPLHPKTITLKPNKDTYSIDIVQSQPFAGQPVLLPGALMLNFIHDLRGDDPNGTSLLWGLPFVAEIMQKVLKNLGSTWDRYGTPRYHVNWLPPDDFNDPDGSISQGVMADLSGNFVSALASGMQGDVVDFYTSGRVTVDIIGAQGDSLAIEMPMRAIAEQIVAATDIPPFAFGLHWAVGEQMTQLQADLLLTSIQNLRAELQPELEYLIDYRQRLTGGDRNVRLLWPEPTLIDIFNKNRAEFFRQTGRQIQVQVNDQLWQMGVISEYDYVREMRPELAHLTDDEIDSRLPDLEHEPPEPMAALPGGPGRTGTGGGGGLNPGSPAGGPGGGNMAADEIDAAVHEVIYRANGGVARFTRNGHS